VLVWVEIDDQNVFTSLRVDCDGVYLKDFIRMLKRCHDAWRFVTVAGVRWEGS
jgi:hypothetical protein